MQSTEVSDLSVAYAGARDVLCPLQRDHDDRDYKREEGNSQKPPHLNFGPLVHEVVVVFHQGCEPVVQPGEGNEPDKVGSQKVDFTVKEQLFVVEAVLENNSKRYQNYE